MSHRRSRTGCPKRLVALVLALTLRGVSAHADEPTADDLFQQGTALLEQGAFADALVKLEEAQRRDPGLGTAFNIAVCNEELGKLATALHGFEEVAEGARAAGKTAREQAARARIAKLTPHVPTLALTTAEHDTRDLVVRLDGSIVDIARPVPLDPGEHALSAVAPMKRPWSTTVSTPSEGTVSIAIPRLEVVQGEAKVVTVTRETTSTRRTLGFIAGGVGLASGIAAIVTSVMIAKAHSTAEDHCTPKCIDANGTYDSIGVDAVNRGKTLLPINAVVWAVAAVGLGAGAVLLWTSRTAAPKPRAAVLLTPQGLSF